MFTPTELTEKETQIHQNAAPAGVFAWAFLQNVYRKRGIQPPALQRSAMCSEGIHVILGTHTEILWMRWVSLTFRRIPVLIEIVV